MALAVSQGYASEDQQSAEDLREAERFPEEKGRHCGGQGTLREKADRSERGGQMAERVGEKEIAAELGDEAEAEDGPDGAAVRHAQGYPHYQIDQQECESAGNHRQAEKRQRAGGAADFFRNHEVDSETRGGSKRLQIADADTRVEREVGPQNDGRAGNGHQEAEPKGARGALTENHPAEEADKDGRVVAQQGGVGGGGLQDSGVVKGQIEGEEKAAESDDAQGAGITRRFGAIEENWRE